MDQLFNSFNLVFTVLSSYWWVYLPIIFFLIAKEVFELYARMRFMTTLKWVVLEIKIPKDVHKSPKAAEQVFLALHVFIPRPKLRFRISNYIKGRMPVWFSFEIVGLGGEVHFFVRVQEDYRNLLEAQIYGHFPEAEIYQVDDYLDNFPESMPDERYDISAGEIELTKEDAFPIRTYPEFEESGGGKEDVRRIDPMASLSEALSATEYGECLGVQIIITATGDDWIKKGQEQIDKLMDKPAKPKGAEKFITGIESAFSKSGQAIFGGGEVKREEKKETLNYQQMNPGKQEAIKAIERSFAKLAFKTNIRFIYFAPKDRFIKTKPFTITGAFKQFSTQNLNGFKMGFSTIIFTGFFKKQKIYNNKVILLERYRDRVMNKKPFALTTEELATVFHFPDVGVKSPSLPRVESKRGEPPAGLPVV